MLARPCLPPILLIPPRDEDGIVKLQQLFGQLEPDAACSAGDQNCVACGFPE